MNEDTWGDLIQENEEITSWLDNTWTMHRYDLENESWKLEWIILRWWAPENQTEKTPALLRMGEKNSHNRKQLWEWCEARTLNLWKNG